jgi:hypothetical protein
MVHFIKSDEGPDGQDGHIMIMQIHQGNTSQHNTIWGRVVGSSAVEICPMGITALY